MNDVDTQVPKVSHYDKSPILHSSKCLYLFNIIDLDFNNLRVADDMATDRKVQSIIDTGRESAAKPPAASNLNDILKGLEEMSNNSTLMDGLDSDDDMPPPLGPKKNLNTVQL